jgi:hypothetical protein
MTKIRTIENFVIPEQRRIAYAAEHELGHSVEKAAEVWAALAFKRGFTNKKPDHYNQAIPQVLLDLLLHYDSKTAAAVMVGWLRSTDAQQVEGLRSTLLETIGEFLPDPAGICE